MTLERHLPVISSSTTSPKHSRREFVQMLSTAMAAVGATGCNDAPPEKIIPYVERPPEVVPGVSRFYATSTSRQGYGFGLLAESREGRPVKLEGHPNHPASRGAIFSPEQAELLSLYDPDRARSVRQGARVRSLDVFFQALHDRTSGLVPRGGKRLHLLVEPTSSPLVRHLLERVTKRLPDATVHADWFAGTSFRLQGAEQALGRPLETHYEFARADVVLDLASNFLGDMPMSAHWARDFASRRDIDAPGGSMNRLYSIEATPSITGVSADHRLALAPSRMPLLVSALVHHVGKLAKHGRGESVPREVAPLAERAASTLQPDEAEFVRGLAHDLAEHASRSVVIVGERMPVSVHVLGHALNALLGNLGKTVEFTASPLLSTHTGEQKGLDDLLASLDAGHVESLFVLGGNPVHKMPGDSGFEERLARAKHRVVLDAYENETAEHASWFLPEQHFLETWGDVRAADGTVSFQQPLIRPLFGGTSQVQLLAALTSKQRPRVREILERYWARHLDSQPSFVRALGKGIVAGSAARRETPSLRWSAVEAALARPVQKTAGLELEFLPDPRIREGRQANNGWLQETPEPVTKLVWDNAVLISPGLARQKGLKRGDVVRVSADSNAIEAPVLPVEGQAEAAMSLWLGYGRRSSEQLASGVGVDAAPLRRAEAPWLTAGVELKRLNRTHSLVTTQDTFEMHERPVALHLSRSEWKDHPEHFQRHDEVPPTLYERRPGEGPQWGMSVDLNRCTGCSACVTACMAENNVPVVGKDQVALGREMSWLRIDTYRSNHQGRRLMQPMMCQHCEHAPCEYVCPVGATVHSPDGLNEMVYNRCVGTRFCSNNCPYKVRRFNWHEYNGDHREPEPMVFNPDVTVRARGVMEKCTFCVQRIRRAEIDAKLEERPLKEGDVTTACEQACPTQAIRFGSLSEENSEVSKAARSKRAFACLGELGTRPRVRYLGRVTSPREEDEP